MSAQAVAGFVEVWLPVAKTNAAKAYEAVRDGDLDRARERIATLEGNLLAVGDVLKRFGVK